MGARAAAIAVYSVADLKLTIALHTHGTQREARTACHVDLGVGIAAASSQGRSIDDEGAAAAQGQWGPAQGSDRGDLWWTRVHDVPGSSEADGTVDLQGSATR